MGKRKKKMSKRESRELRTTTRVAITFILRQLGWTHTRIFQAFQDASKMTSMETYYGSYYKGLKQIGPEGLMSFIQDRRYERFKRVLLSRSQIVLHPNMDIFKQGDSLCQTKNQSTSHSDVHGDQSSEQVEKNT